MQFHNNFTQPDVGSIDETLGDEDMKNAWKKQIEHSETWQKHREQHANAEIVDVDTNTPQPEEKKPNEHNPVKYDSQTGVFPTATCNCGLRFEMHQDSGKVYNAGNALHETSATSYRQGQDEPSGDMYKKNEPLSPDRIFSYKN
jgi:hypothetical protein